MQKGWLRNLLTPEKRDSELYGPLADMLQDMFDKHVDPTLERIESRRSFFTMSPQDLATRISELGRFFRISTSKQASIPIILQQRLDEIHYKGTAQPLTASIRRELNNLPATWAPMYAPIDQTKYPYGSYFTDASTLSVDTKTYGDFFLTSRGKIKIPLNDLYLQYSGKDQAELTRKLTEEFDDVIQPLIPLHIVFDGFMFYLQFDVETRQTVFYMTTADEKIYLPKQLTRKTTFEDFQINNLLPGQTLVQQPRELTGNIHRFDQMPIDAWAMDMMELPAILPSSRVPDTRYRESAAHKVEIDTLGMYGVQVIMTDHTMAMYHWPEGATTYELPTLWTDVKKIEKITYRFF